MATFQLDECLSARKLLRACAAEGVATVRPMPRRLKGSLDPTILATFMPAMSPLLTVDAAIADEHCGDIPDHHPGIVIIANAPTVPQTMTVSIAQRILSRLKKDFREWHRTDLRNSILRVTQDGVEVSRVIDGSLQGRLVISFSELNWTEKLSEVLRENAANA